MAHTYHVGDKVVYTRDKYSSCPGPRAKNVDATPKGELYQYQVDKYWIVADVRGKDVVLETRRGKRHVLSCDDLRLRKASWFERIFRSKLFPTKGADSRVTHSHLNSSPL